ncbi:MAG: hypothetical protein ACRC24_00575 [Vibrionaceae bacterium]
MGVPNLNPESRRLVLSAATNLSAGLTQSEGQSLTVVGVVVRGTPDAGPQTNTVELLAPDGRGGLAADPIGTIITQNRETTRAEDLGPNSGGRLTVTELVSRYESRLTGEVAATSVNTARHSNRSVVVEAAMREGLTETQRELGDTKADRDRVLKELQAAQERVTELETSIGKLEGDLKKAQGGSATKQKELAAVTGERDDALRVCAELRRNLTQAQSDLQDATNDAQTKQEQAQTALNAAVRAQEAAQEAQTNAEKELEKAKTGSAEDKAAAKAAQAEVERLQKAAELQLAELKKARADLTESQTALQQAQARTKELETQLNAATKQIGVLEERVQQLEQEVAQLKLQITELQTALDEAVGALEETEEARKAAEKAANDAADAAKAAGEESQKSKKDLLEAKAQVLALEKQLLNANTLHLQTQHQLNETQMALRTSQITRRASWQPATGAAAVALGPQPELAGVLRANVVDLTDDVMRQLEAEHREAKDKAEQCKRTNASPEEQKEADAKFVTTGLALYGARLVKDLEAARVAANTTNTSDQSRQTQAVRTSAQRSSSGLDVLRLHCLYQRELQQLQSQVTSLMSGNADLRRFIEEHCQTRLVLSSGANTGRRLTSSDTVSLNIGDILQRLQREINRVTGHEEPQLTAAAQRRAVSADRRGSQDRPLETTVFVPRTRSSSQDPQVRPLAERANVYIQSTVGATDGAGATTHVRGRQEHRVTTTVMTTALLRQRQIVEGPPQLEFRDQQQLQDGDGGAGTADQTQPHTPPQSEDESET